MAWSKIAVMVHEILTATTTKCRNCKKTIHKGEETVTIRTKVKKKLLARLCSMECYTSYEAEWTTGRYD